MGFSVAVPSLPIRATTAAPLLTLPTSAYSGGSPALAPVTTKNWLPELPGRLRRALRHRDRPFGVGEVGGRLLNDGVAGTAGAGAEGVAALDHEARDDAVEGEVVVEPLLRQVGEGVGGLGRLLGVERDVEGAATRLHHGGQLFARLHRLLRRLEADVLGASALPPACSRWRWPSSCSSCCRRCGRSGSPPPRRLRARAKTARTIQRRSGVCSSIGAED